MNLTIVIRDICELTEEILKNLKSGTVKYEIILVESPIFSYSTCDLADKYGCFHLVVEQSYSMKMFEALESIYRGEVIAFIDNDVLPCDGWIDEAYNTHKKYPNSKFVGGPVNIKTKQANLKEVAKKKWPIQLVNKSVLYNNGTIITSIPTQVLVHANLSVKAIDFWKLGRQNIRIGKIGQSDYIGDGCYYIDNEHSIYNERMAVTYET